MKAKLPVIPGDLVITKAEFEKRLLFARENSGAIHIDVSDGEFVKEKALSIDEWPALDIEYSEAHLMVNSPLAYIPKMKKVGVVRSIVHIESFFDLDELVELARHEDMLLGFAINPDTDLEYLKPFLEVGNYVQVMGIDPGKTGQQLLEQTPLAITYLRRIPRKRLTITVDGGVHLNNIQDLLEAGANYFIASSAIYNKGNWATNYKHMLQKVENAQR